MENNTESDRLEQKLDVILRELKYNNVLTKSVILRSFVIGIFTGLGATVGVGILLAVLSFLIKLAGGFPVVGTFFIQFGKFLHQ